ncbi:VOC family protein [Herbiconiux sp. CPCC 203407]|uniref:VOC family protein n=1 Tax=Herbiconiux oxytropis TaxID=2970915 RepID=A0AA41XFQ0_9MICO|nr:VOC family protein [Herbiconiux oxytropis]MCS5722688.1 VOC family protein [Herbiconiux oxytropis]MCS5725385.1 VOC family protein [Herbiconiux oxytropis]
MIGSLDVVVLDCPDPAALAGFYAEVLGMRIVPDDEGPGDGGEDDAAEAGDGIDWVEIGRPGADSVLAFQRVADYTPPEWPGQRVPQQLHLDIRVDDLDTGEAALLALGATATGEGEETFRVYLDPAGHPFCLVSSAD